MIHGQFYNGYSSKAHNCTLELRDQEWIVWGEGEEQLATAPQIHSQWNFPIGRATIILRLSKGGEFHTEDWDGVQQWAQAPQIHRFESSYKWALSGLIIIIALIGAIYLWGLPYLCGIAAYRVPISWESNLAEQSLKQFDHLIFQPSTLSQSQQNRIRQKIAPLWPRGLPKMNIQFRNSPQIGPNAFALGAGTVILTDQMIAAASDTALMGVMAHEMGHLSHRHLMRTLLAQAGVFAIFSALTGDLVNLGNLVTSFSSTLINLSYARDCEREADHFAVEILQTRHISPEPLVHLLDSLSRDHESQNMQFLSNHPYSDEREKILRSKVEIKATLP